MSIGRLASAPRVQAPGRWLAGFDSSDLGRSTLLLAVTSANIRQWTAAYMRICSLDSAMRAPARRRHFSARVIYSSTSVVDIKPPSLVAMGAAALPARPCKALQLAFISFPVAILHEIINRSEPKTDVATSVGWDTARQSTSVNKVSKAWERVLLALLLRALVRRQS